MSWFVRIEETCAAFIERAFANLFPSDVEPTHIARKLVATMEARTENVDGTMIAPAAYRVCLSAADYRRLREHQAYLQSEWSALLDDIARRVGIRLRGHAAKVTLCEEESAGPGGIAIRLEGETQEERRARFALKMISGTPGARYYVDGATRVGRNAQFDIFLVDPSVSRNHALLDVFAGRLIVRDEGSSNGTFVNGERVQVRAVEPGDTIAFGKTKMVVEEA